MNIQKILIFITYILLILILLFSKKAHVSQKDDVITNIKLYNEIKKHLNSESDINYNLEISSNRYIRYINTLVGKMKNNKNKYIYNKVVEKIKSLNNITYLKITNKFDNIQQLYDDKLINIIISLDKKFKIKYKNKIKELYSCYYDSNINVSIEFNSDVIFIQLLKSYGKNKIKSSIIKKYKQKLIEI